MSRTTGPILAVGAITITNRTIFHRQPMDWRIPIATGLAAGAFALAERAWAEGATALAYMCLFSVLFARLQPDVPSPVETALDFWNGKKV